MNYKLSVPQLMHLVLWDHGVWGKGHELGWYWLQQSMEHTHTHKEQLGTLSYKLCLVWHKTCIFRVQTSQHSIQRSREMVHMFHFNPDVQVWKMDWQNWNHIEKSIHLVNTRWQWLIIIIWKWMLSVIDNGLTDVYRMALLWTQKKNCYLIHSCSFCILCMFYLLS